MAKKSNKYLKITEQYLNNLQKIFQIEKAIVFGSAAQGKMSRNSDIDFLVISPDFKGKSFLKRFMILSRNRQGEARKIAMDILAYTPEEFKKLRKNSAILNQAAKEGIILTK